MKHSPGPWMAGVAGLHGSPMLPIVNSAGNVAGMATTPANAALMAAAPDLLAALEGVLRVADRRTDEFDAARAAIAKARTEA